MLKEMLDEGDSVLLLLAGGINVGDEKRCTVATNQGTDPMIIELFLIGLSLVIIGGVVGLLALINSLVGYDRMYFLWLRLSNLGNVYTDLIDLFLGEKVLWFMESGAVASGPSVSMMEVPINCHMDVATPVV